MNRGRQGVARAPGRGSLGATELAAQLTTEGAAVAACAATCAAAAADAAGLQLGPASSAVESMAAAPPPPAPTSPLPPAAATAPTTVPAASGVPFSTPCRSAPYSVVDLPPWGSAGCRRRRDPVPRRQHVGERQAELLHCCSQHSKKRGCTPEPLPAVCCSPPFSAAAAAASTARACPSWRRRRRRCSQRGLLAPRFRFLA